MALSQQIVWTPIPRGWNGDGTRLRCSIVISPRLQASNTTQRQLKHYPDWLNWPEHLADVAISLEFSNGAKVTASDYVRISQSQAAVWSAIFLPSTPVQPYTFPVYAHLPISSYPVRPLMQFIQTLYRTFGQHAPDAVPQLPERPDEKVPSWFETFYQELVELNLDDIDSWIQRRRMLRSRLREQKAIAWDQPTLRETFEWVQYFHEPMNAANPPNPNPTYAEAYSPYKRASFVKPQPEFHEMLTALLNHPLLLQRLGLVLVLEFPLPSGLPPSGWMQLQVSWTPAMAATTDVTPKVQYQLDAGKRLFVAQPAAGSDINEGLINLQNGRYEVHTVDPDSAARKLLGFSSSLRRIRTGVPAAFQSNVQLGGLHAVAPASRQVGTPTLQSVGFMVVRHNLAYAVLQKLQRAKVQDSTVQGGGTAVLFADDLLRGYRVDVWDSLTQQWHSLCLRQAQYHLLRIGQQITGIDEGTLSLAPTARADAPPDEMRLHEGLMVWKGWSLAVQRPGKTIDTEDLPADPANEPLKAYQVKAVFAVPKRSLPRLRFGEQYRFRFRMVDLAGYSRSFEEIDPADVTHTSDALPYYRWEPVPNPVVLLRTLPDPITQTGESLEIMAIRTFIDDPESLPPTTQISERHIAAPRGSVELAEQHGKLDTGPNGTLNPDTYSMLVKREDTLPGGAALFPEQTWTNPVTGEKIKYPVQEVPLVKTPYIPDPFARGAVFQNVPGLAMGSAMWIFPDGTVKVYPLGLPDKNVVVVNFGNAKDWPDVPGFRLVLAEGENAPQWEATERVLTLFLPKGAEQTVLYSACLGATPEEARTNRDHLALWHLLTAGAPPAVRKRLEAASIYGLQWMLTPPRALTLVHAVSQPLAVPEIQKIAQFPQRGFGETKAALRLDLNIDAKSTGKAAIVGQWRTPIDNPAEPLPQDGKDGRALPPQGSFSVGELIIDDRQQDLLTNVALVHEFGDTKYRKVRYRAIGVSRYREFFDPQLPEKDFAREGPAQEVEILNAARPAGLRIPYAIPAFRWHRTQGPNWVVSERTPLTRIYIERPWYVSGDGELLAVLLPELGNADAKTKLLGSKQLMAKLFGGPTLPALLQPYVTQWGLDPIWIAEALPTDLSPTPVMFEDVVQVQQHLTLEELAGTSHTVTAVGIEPQYDADRQWWYADVNLKPGAAYFPFVRFAVARYQPSSIANAHLSKVTALDFLQILPWRKAKVVRDGATIRIVVEGYTYRSAFALHANSEMEATVEVLAQDASPEFGWEPVATVGLDRMESRLPGFWVGNIDLEALKLAPDRKVRIVLKEFEQWVADAPSAKGKSLGFLKAASPPDPMMGTRLTRRLVYADTLMLP